jgi:hypothetical protein
MWEKNVTKLGNVRSYYYVEVTTIAFLNLTWKQKPQKIKKKVNKGNCKGYYGQENRLYQSLVD